MPVGVSLSLGGKCQVHIQNEHKKYNNILYLQDEMCEIFSLAVKSNI